MEQGMRDPFPWLFFFFLISKGKVYLHSPGVLALTLQTRLTLKSETHLLLPSKCWNQRHAPPFKILIKWVLQFEFVFWDDLGTCTCPVLVAWDPLGLAWEAQGMG